MFKVKIALGRNFLAIVPPDGWHYNDRDVWERGSSWTARQRRKLWCEQACFIISTVLGTSLLPWALLAVLSMPSH